jgi:hypothetical protein
MDVPKIQNWVHQNGGNIATEVIVNFAGPFLIYDYSHKALGDVRGLMASSAPPIAWSLIEFARHRRVDALSLLVLTGIGLSLLAFLGGGGAHMLQLREKLVTGLIGMVFLGSAAIGRPLIYQLARATLQRRGSEHLERFESMKDDGPFKRTMTFMTLVWGVGLTLEAGIGVALVLTLSVRAYLLVSPVVGYSTMGALTAWTWWYARSRQRLGEARRAAAEAAAAAVPPEA